ncbi:MAG: glucose-1-phosphate adenylyltransferase [Deltaproteobacteria bacterium]|nr:glucose-1-phosphate adenylyltransferase [Deltaproteobacteria bacterium]
MPVETLVMIMAGGKGQRLAPLTSHRAKPAVPFGGRYRIIDFALSNLVNSGYRHIYLLTQYMAMSLIKHLNRTWHVARMGEFIEVAPAQMRRGNHWYAGTADAVYQNLNLVADARPKHVAIFGGDHIYLMAVDQMEEFHKAQAADLTVAVFRVPRDEATAFGVVEVNESGRIVGFEEKPRDPKPIPGHPDQCLVSMGNYFFRRDVLEQVLIQDAPDESSKHDFGQDIIPRMIREGGAVFAYDFSDNRVPGEERQEVPYWRDVGTIESLFQSNMDLRAPVPPIDLYNRRWPIRTTARHHPPARFVQDGAGGRLSEVQDSLIAEGVIVSSARVFNVVAGYDCFFHAGSEVADSVLLSGCDIGAGARLSRVLLDKNVRIAPGTVIGESTEADRRRFPFVTPTGIVVLPKGTRVPKVGPIEIAADMVELLQMDESVSQMLRDWGGKYVQSPQNRNTDEQIGPRFSQYGRR